MSGAADTQNWRSPVSRRATARSEAAEARARRQAPHAGLRPEGLEVVFDGATNRARYARALPRRGWPDPGRSQGSECSAYGAVRRADELTASDTQLTVRGSMPARRKQRIQLADGAFAHDPSIVSVAADSPDGTTVRAADAALSLARWKVRCQGFGGPCGAGRQRLVDRARCC